MMHKSIGHVKPKALETNTNKEICTHGASTLDSLGLHVHTFAADMG